MATNLMIHSMVAKAEHPVRMREAARAGLVAAAAATAPRRVRLRGRAARRLG